MEKKKDLKKEAITWKDEEQKSNEHTEQSIKIVEKTVINVNI